MSKRLIDEKQQAMEALQRHNRNLSLLNQVGQELTSMRNLQQVTEYLLQVTH